MSRYAPTQLRDNFIAQTVAMVVIVGAFTVALVEGNTALQVVFLLPIVAYVTRWLPTLLRGIETIAKEVLPL